MDTAADAVDKKRKKNEEEEEEKWKYNILFSCDILNFPQYESFTCAATK